MESLSDTIERSRLHRRLLRFLSASPAGLDIRFLNAAESAAAGDLELGGVVERSDHSLRLRMSDPQASSLIERSLRLDSADGLARDEDLDRIRSEHEQLSDLLGLIRGLTRQSARIDSMAELFRCAFATLVDKVSFDVAAAVIIGQNFDLYVSSRGDAEIAASDRLIARIRQTLQEEIPVSFAGTDMVIQAMYTNLPAREGMGDPLGNHTYSVLNAGDQTVGLLLLYRSEPRFGEDDRQIVEIFSTEVAMLMGSIRARQEIVNLADTDDLTGIWNKRYFTRHLPQEIERARIYVVPLALLMIDIDDFKQINDSFGHTIGDVVLSELCGTVRETLRPPDTFARFGGDEFAVILPHTDQPGACAVAERILAHVGSLAIPTDEESSVVCSVSIGIADFQSADDTATDLIRRADERLYLSKRQGKNRFTAGNGEAR